MNTFQLRFNPIGHDPALAFPCDAKGEVDYDSLPERARTNLFRAFETQGRSYLSPVILPDHKM